MVWDKEITVFKFALKPKDIDQQLDEIIHSTRYSMLFSQQEFDAAQAVIEELRQLRRFKKLALTYTQAFSEEMEKI